MRLIKYKNERIVANSEFNPNYEFVNVVDTNIHTDIHTLSNLDRYGLSTGRDYNFVRDHIMALVVESGGFDNITDSNDKYVSAKWICTTETQALTVMSSEEYDNFVGVLVDSTYASREKRRLLAKREIGKEVVKGTMSYDESNQLDTDSADLARSWVNANNPLFKDWILGINTYSGSGFPTKEYATPERQQVLIDMIISGSITI